MTLGFGYKNCWGAVLTTMAYSIYRYIFGSLTGEKYLPVDGLITSVLNGITSFQQFNFVVTARLELAGSRDKKSTLIFAL